MQQKPKTRKKRRAQPSKKEKGSTQIKSNSARSLRKSAGTAENRLMRLKSNARNNTGRKPGRSRNNSRHSNTSGSSIGKFGNSKPSFRKSYHPEYNKIDLPSPPENLHCAICRQAICGNVDIWEALEIHPGEFGAKENAESLLSAHFECVLQALSVQVQLEPGEAVAYRGGGNFAVVHGPQRIVRRLVSRDEWRQNSNLSPTNWSSWRQNSSSPTLVAALSIKTDV